MRYLALVVFFLSLYCFAQIDRRELVKARCSADFSEPVVYSNDFPWDQFPGEMEANFLKHYQSGKRLAQRAYFDLDKNDYYVQSPKSSHPVKLPKLFLNSVLTHLEISLEKGWAKHLFFSDLGHGHIFIQAKARDQKGHVMAKDPLVELLNLPEISVLYHAAEKLIKLTRDYRPIEDIDIKKRVEERNIIGQISEHNKQARVMSGPGGPLNVLSHIPQMKEKVAFHLSASQNGCFPVRQSNGQTLFVDLSFFAPEPDPDVVDNDGGGE